MPESDSHARAEACARLHAAEDIDTSFIAQIRDIDDGGGLLADIIKTYLDDMPQRLKLLHRACAEGDADAMHRAAHAIKGSSSNLGLRGMVSCASAIAETARQGRSSGLEDAVKALDQAWQRAQELLATVRQC